MDTVPILLRQNSDGTITNDLAEENAKAASRITVDKNGKAATKKFGSVEQLQQRVALTGDKNGTTQLFTLSELIQRGTVTEQHARDITKQLSMTEVQADGETYYVPSYQADGLTGAFTDGNGIQAGNTMLQTGTDIGSTKSDKEIDAFTNYELNDTIDKAEDNNTLDIDEDLFSEYLQDVEDKTGMKIPSNQRAELENAMENETYRKLSPAETREHRNTYDNLRDTLIAEWEKMTGRTWPTYKENVYSKSGELLKSLRQRYDAHHIIEVSFGGDNIWWNLHPARFPDVHQKGIHGKGSIANKLFNGGK